MNIKPIAILAACVCFIAGCNKSPTTPTANNNASQPSSAPIPARVQAEPFHGQVYKSANGRNVLTLTSKDECELMQDGTTLPCKYTKQTDALRVIATVMGTPQVIYFRFTDQGLQDNNGNVLLSPEKYAAVIEQQRQEAMAEQQKQLAAERQQREAQRVAEVIANSKQKTQDISTFTLAPSALTFTQESDPSKGTVTLTDVSLIFSTQVFVKYYGTWNNNNFTVNFASIRKIGEVGEGTKSSGFVVEEQEQSVSQLQLYYTTDLPASLYFNTESEARTAHDALLKAFNAWKAKFPEAILK